MDDQDKMQLMALSEKGLVKSVERAVEKIDSKQPRFKVDYSSFWSAVSDWLRMADLEEPSYASQSMTRDRWLAEFWRAEPHLAGVVNSSMLIQQNRGWTVTGGRNTVNRTIRILHNWEVFPTQHGWRPGMGTAALGFYSTDMGAVEEQEKEVENGPLKRLIHTDPTRCELTSSYEFPLRYHPSGYSSQLWQQGDFLRVADMTSIQEGFNGLGFCSVSRVLDLAKIMRAIYQHDQEQLLARAPRGILMLENIEEEQWEKALQARKAKLDSLEQKYFGSVLTLAGGMGEQPKATLVALSQLPANFDQLTFTNLLMYGYALCFGFDAAEFWPVAFSSIGRGSVDQVQHMKATTKGGLAFSLAFQEQLQRALPVTVEFQFDQRDDEGELLEAEKSAKWAQLATDLNRPPELGAPPLLSWEEARSFLVLHGVIPEDWTVQEEDSFATDQETSEIDRWKGEAVERLLMILPNVPDEARDWVLRQPIVRSSQNFVMGMWKPREKVLWNSGYHALKPRMNWKIRQDVLYENEELDFTITNADVERAIKDWNRRMPEDAQGLLEAEEIE